VFGAAAVFCARRFWNRCAKWQREGGAHGRTAPRTSPRRLVRP
jgi:hypothetical protein